MRTRLPGTTKLGHTIFGGCFALGKSKSRDSSSLTASVSLVACAIMIIPPMVMVKRRMRSWHRCTAPKLHFMLLLFALLNTNTINLPHICIKNSHRRDNNLFCSHYVTMIIYMCVGVCMYYAPCKTGLHNYRTLPLLSTTPCIELLFLRARALVRKNKLN